MPKVAVSSKLRLLAEDETYHRKFLSYNYYQILRNDLNIFYDYGQRW